MDQETYLVPLSQQPDRIITLRRSRFCELAHKLSFERLPGFSEEGRNMTAELATIGATILRRLEASSTAAASHAFSVSSSSKGERIEVGTVESADSLFVLQGEANGRFTLSAPHSNPESFSREELSRVEPDPLWESADGICSHMEDDHADTFGLFLSLVGRSDLADGQIRMPWVEASGFYLTAGSEHVFIPFPQRCEDANSVRATLIKMLRGARAASSTH